VTISDLVALLKDAGCSIDEIVDYILRYHQDTKGVVDL
jgi:hypothetical protein